MPAGTAHAARALPPGHPGRLSGLGKRKEEYKRRLHALQVAQLGPEHADIATTMANTAGLLKAMGRTADAETVYRTVSQVWLIS
jgi:hypothetical protein